MRVTRERPTSGAATAFLLAASSELVTLGSQPQALLGEGWLKLTPLLLLSEQGLRTVFSLSLSLSLSLTHTHTHSLSLTLTHTHTHTHTQVDIRLPGKGKSHTHGTRPVR